jgi:organic hydroperoxide reductase OsmC/OhrA
MAREIIFSTKLGILDGEVVASNVESKSPIKIKMMQDEKEDAWDPPHLYVSAIESAMMNTLLVVADNLNVGINGYSSETEAKLVSHDGKHREVSEVTIHMKIDLKNEEDRSKLKEIAKMTEDYCLIAKSIRTRINFEIEG